MYCRPYKFYLIATISLLLISSCSRVPAELDQAAHIVYHFLAPKNLEQSAFYAAHPDGKASDFVSYFFSDMGVAEWPPWEDGASEMEKIQAKALGGALIPEDVSLISLQPDPSLDKQLVLKFDDNTNEIIVEGYLDPSEKPVLIRRYELHKVKPSPLARVLYESNAGIGMSSRSF